MTPVRADVIDSLLLDLSTLKLTNEQFYQLCIYQLCTANPEQPVELTAAGVLVVMPPIGGESGSYESELGADVINWNRRTQLGKVFSSSTVFKLPDGSQRSPDVAWVERSRWEALTQEERKKFPPLAPDFVIELKSETDCLPKLQTKMQEYRDNGVRLGWLTNPQDRTVEIYRVRQAEPRLGQEVEVIQSPFSLNGEDVLPGFTLEINLIW